MKLLIVGSRTIHNFDLAPYVPKDVDTIISGGANGVDTLAEEYADKNRISKLIMRPAYARYGKGAPLKRNEEMVKLADAVLVIWDGVSRGTRYTAEFAKKEGKTVTVVTIDEAK